MENIARTHASKHLDDLDLGAIWARSEEGWLFPDPEPIKRFEDVVNKLLKLLKKFYKNEDLSELKVTKALQTAVFESVDIKEKRDKNLDVRLDSALQKLWKFLNTPPKEYECYILVSGLDPRSLPACFGDLRFVVFNEDHIQRLNKKHTDKMGRDMNIDLVNETKESFLNKLTAIVKVNARDTEAARLLADRTARTTIECLNFFLQFDHALIAPFLGTTYLTVSDSDSSIQIMRSLLTPREGSFSIAELREGKIIKTGNIERIESLLLKKSRNEVEELLLRAVCWAGRGKARGEKRDESFLMLTIALECLILPPPRKAELNYRLSQRVAWLMGRNASGRKSLVKDIKELYDIRSKILHDGTYDIRENEKDYRFLFWMAEEIIAKLLANSDVKELHKLKDLEDWFNDLTLQVKSALLIR